MRPFTPTPTFFGTPRYTSPEQVRSAKLVDARTDQHALGIILYELLTGTDAFEGEALAAAVNICTKPRPNPCDALPELPAGVGAAVVRAMAEERDARFHDLAELASAIAPYGGPAAFDHVKAISSVLQASAPLRDPREADTISRPDAAVLAATNTNPFDDTAATLRGHTQPAPPRAQPRSRAPWVILGAAIAFGLAGVTWTIAKRPRAELDAAAPHLAARAAALAPAVAIEPTRTDLPAASESAAPPPIVTPAPPTATPAAKAPPVRTPSAPLKKPDPAPPPAPPAASPEQGRKPRSVFDTP
jgi:serine/threonine-protein kinase